MNNLTILETKKTTKSLNLVGFVTICISTGGVKEVPCLYNNPSKYGAFDMLFKNRVTNRVTRLSKSFLNYVNVWDKTLMECILNAELQEFIYSSKYLGKNQNKLRR